MGKIQITLLVIVALGLLALSLATWGSIGSILCVLCLILMGAALLYRKFILERDPDDFNFDP